MRGARVLIVDDEPANREILGRALELQGHAVSGAASAEEAEDLLRGAAFDFILCDNVLPGRTGMQSLASLKKLSAAPIHIMSGQTDADTRRDALALGAAGFFAKPLELSALAAAVAALPER